MRLVAFLSKYQLHSRSHKAHLNMIHSQYNNSYTMAQKLMVWYLNGHPALTSDFESSKESAWGEFIAAGAVDFLLWEYMIKKVVIRVREYEIVIGVCVPRTRTIFIPFRSSWSSACDPDSTAIMWCPSIFTPISPFGPGNSSVSCNSAFRTISNRTSKLL